VVWPEKTAAMKTWILNNRLIFLGGLLGGLAGFVYWKYWGCVNGCTITSSPRNSTIYFALLGGLVFGIFKKKTHANKKQIF
jgi:hypothetical protein